MNNNNNTFENFNIKEEEYYFYKTFPFDEVDLIALWNRLNTEVFNGENTELEFKTNSKKSISIIEGKIFDYEKFALARQIAKEEAQKKHDGKIDFYIHQDRGNVFEMIGELRKEFDNRHIDKHIQYIDFEMNVVHLSIDGLSENLIEVIKKILENNDIPAFY